MTKLHNVYKCEICGNIIEVVHPGAPALVCCSMEMKLMEEKTADSAVEKHVPVIEKTANGIKVKVGSVPHPMDEKHFIEWIEVIAGNQKFVRFLKPGEPAEAEFWVKNSPITVREYCNIHGLWKNEA
ncbi:MAG TPA: desulfoferrodoxin [Candidatus Rifleibacterium sp.]|nr:desulfoferrodoxin [Candidatus Rifleibacterium sp.]